MNEWLEDLSVSLRFRFLWLITRHDICYSISHPYSRHGKKKATLRENCRFGNAIWRLRNRSSDTTALEPWHHGIIYPHQQWPLAQKTDLGWGMVGVADVRHSNPDSSGIIDVSHRDLTCEIKITLDIEPNQQGTFKGWVLLFFRGTIIIAGLKDCNKKRWIFSKVLQDTLRDTRSRFRSSSRSRPHKQRGWKRRYSPSRSSPSDSRYVLRQPLDLSSALLSPKSMRGPDQDDALSVRARQLNWGEVSDDDDVVNVPGKAYTQNLLREKV